VVASAAPASDAELEDEPDIVFTPDDVVDMLLLPPSARPPEPVLLLAPVTPSELVLPLPPETPAELLALVPPSASGALTRFAAQPPAKTVRRPPLAHKPAIPPAICICTVHCDRVSAPLPNILIRALCAPLAAPMILDADEA
jgi:hypothetical protein